ncbi:hypothetical protein DFJ58DRAFT_722786 [Suillus subalutaceus]|uniref:uncharacterized protein n=1 Tax=Suillus subalutaceus TaxID=48586 RepID=UPI001B86E2B0|nr:uncharacterized protein DFJ58DRAFT_722786 [Suillus subalutaceus]KAG1871363.1 hypothetical protein DFJ58DRAFT_722786 [Suillus subalutaceus]
MSTMEGSTTASRHHNRGAQPSLTVRSIIPNPTKCLIDNSEVEEYDETLLMRLRKLSEYTNSKANIYALGKLLPTATWGQYKPINNRSKVLCDPATGDPITIWVVGRIAKMWFMRFGKPESRVTLTIMPLSRTLAHQSVLLLAKFSTPALSENNYILKIKYDCIVGLTPQGLDIICTIKWQNVRGGDTVNKAILFDTVYDARRDRSLKTYSERPIWNLTDLKSGDLVLLEMKMTHYSKKQEDNKWHSRAQYEMIAISLLDIAEFPEEDGQGTTQIDGLAI